MRCCSHYFVVCVTAAKCGSTPISEGVTTNPKLRFEAGIKKALAYGKVFVQGEAASSHDCASSKLSASQADSSGTWSKVLFPNLELALSEEEIIAAQAISALLISLRDTKEDTVQTSLNSHLTLLRAIDTHLSQLRMDFKYPVGNPAAFQPSAKPDLTATLLPLFWELKDRQRLAPVKNKGEAKPSFNAPEWNVLEQAIERVLVRSQLSAFLSFVCCLATTGMRAWVVYVTRDLPKAAGETPSLELHIWQVPIEALATLAFALNSKSVADPSWFLTSDGPAIIEALTSIGVSPLQCRVKFIEQSMDRVYLLNLPVEAHRSPFQVFANCASLALKVVGGDRYTQEADALRKIAKSGGVAGFYALGAAPSTEAVWFKKEEKKEEDGATLFLSELAKVGHEGWWSTERSPQNGGVIIMRPAATNLPTGEGRGAIVAGVRRTLAAAHKLDIVHTDIRHSNILYFGAVPGEENSEGWQLIDFGLSSKAGATIEVQANSSRGRRCGVRILSLVNASKTAAISCDWEKGDDFEMLDGLELPRS